MYMYDKCTCNMHTCAYKPILEGLSVCVHAAQVWRQHQKGEGGGQIDYRGATTVRLIQTLYGESGVMHSWKIVKKCDFWWAHGVQKTKTGTALHTLSLSLIL